MFKRIMLEIFLRLNLCFVVPVYMAELWFRFSFTPVPMYEGIMGIAVRLLDMYLGIDAVFLRSKVTSGKNFWRAITWECLQAFILVVYVLDQLWNLFSQRKQFIFTALVNFRGFDANYSDDLEPEMENLRLSFHILSVVVFLLKIFLMSIVASFIRNKRSSRLKSPKMSLEQIIIDSTPLRSSIQNNEDVRLANGTAPDSFQILDECEESASNFETLSFETCNSYKLAPRLNLDDSSLERSINETEDSSD